MQNQQPVSSPIYEHSHGEHSNSEQQWQHRSQQQMVNFKILWFDGTEALGWIFVVDQYFDFLKMSEAEQVGIATLQMTGIAIPWFQMSQRFAQFQSWTHMKRVIELDFGPSLFKSPRELLFKLQQHGTVSEYYSEFVALANRTNIEPQDVLRDCFITGLHPEIKREVKVQCPPSLMRAVSLARLYEDKLAPSMKTTNAASPYKSITHTQTSYPPAKPPPPKLSLPTLLPNPNQPP